MKHGRYARGLPSKLLAAGYRDGASLYAGVRADIQATFHPLDARQRRRAERLANRVFCLARRAGVFGTKPECPVFSATLGLQSPSLFPIRIHDPWNRVGLVFWVQRKAFWNLPKLLVATFGGAPVQEPPLRQTLESRIRCRVFRMRRPSLWDRQKYGLNANEPRAPQPPPQTELDRLRAKVAAALARANPHERLEETGSSGKWVEASQEGEFLHGILRLATKL